MTFGVHKLVRSEPCLDNLYEIWQLLSALYSDLRKKKLYRCTYTFLALNYCGGTLFRSLSYLYEVGRTNFSVDFWIFTIFWLQFRKKLWHHLATKICTLWRHWKGDHFWKNVEINQNRPINHDTILDQSMSPSNE